MADASGPAAEKLIPGAYTHRASGMEYDIAAVDRKAVLNYRGSQSASKKGTLPLSYFLGSGHLGTTYLYSVDKFLFESPIAWYSDLKGYDMKPGLAEMKEVPPSLPMQTSCLRCHMSAVQAERGRHAQIYTAANHFFIPVSPAKPATATLRST